MINIFGMCIKLFSDVGVGKNHLPWIWPESQVLGISKGLKTDNGSRCCGPEYEHKWVEIVHGSYLSGSVTFLSNLVAHGLTRKFA